jgi:hypothetical protein
MQLYGCSLSVTSFSFALSSASVTFGWLRIVTALHGKLMG